MLKKLLILIVLLSAGYLAYNYFAVTDDGMVIYEHVVDGQMVYDTVKVVSGQDQEDLKRMGNFFYRHRHSISYGGNVFLLISYSLFFYHLFVTGAINIDRRNNKY